MFDRIAVLVHCDRVVGVEVEMKSSYQRLAVSFWLAARGLWRERWNALIGSAGFGVLVLIVKWITP